MIGSPRLLITDDDRDFRETLGGVFQSRGFTTLLAADGEEAVRVVETEHIHVVLIDMHMPKLTGLEAISRIKEVQQKVPCILISAAMDETIRSQASDAFSLLEKPVSFKSVTETVSLALATAYGA